MTDYVLKAEASSKRLPPDHRDKDGKPLEKGK